MTNLKALEMFCNANLRRAKLSHDKDSIYNSRAMCYGALRFCDCSRLIPYEELSKIWEGEEGYWQKFQNLLYEV